MAYSKDFTVNVDAIQVLLHNSTPFTELIQNPIGLMNHQSVHEGAPPRYGYGK